MQNFSYWLIAGSLTLVVGTIASFVGAGTGGAVLGSTTGAVLGAAISSKLQDDKQRKTEIELKLLKEQLAKQHELVNLNTLLTILKTRVAELRKTQTELSTVEGQFVQKQAELQQVNQRLTTLSQQRGELEWRIAAINQQQPNLSRLEQLQVQIEQFRLDKSGLEGQIHALHSQIESLEAQKQSLKNVDAEFAAKKTQLELLNKQIQDLETKSQQEYQKIEELRQILRSLNIEIRDKESQLRELKREIQDLNGIKAGIEENNARLKQEEEELQDEIKRLKGEIDNLQNSTTVALRSLREPLWSNLPDTKWSASRDEHVFLEDFTRYIQSKGLAFPKRVIHAFHTSLKVQDISALVILAGISGTGKSELPQRYADYIGAQLLTLAVQPRWDSPQDLQGFYNYVEKKFKPTDLMRGLYQYNHHSGMKDRIVIVLLDEMNLARVEYYFSEFISKLETRRSREASLEIDVGSLPLTEGERKLRIPKEFLFVGTMNEDETTHSLSDKVLDRANVIIFGKPQNLQLRQDNQVQNGNAKPSGYLTYSDFHRWTITPDRNSEVVEKVKSYLDRTNQVMEKMGHPFAHRVYQSITQYVVNYPMVESTDLKFAIADQFGQKLLPKLRGVMIDDVQRELETLEQIITEIGDYPLMEAFSKACEGRYGQFHWQGLVYQDEPAR